MHTLYPSFFYSYKGKISGNGNYVSNINLLGSNNGYIAIFGYCENSTITDIDFLNFSFSPMNYNYGKSIICASALNAVFRNIYINISDDININGNLGLICHDCKNITVQNVTIES